MFLFTFPYFHRHQPGRPFPIELPFLLQDRERDSELGDWLDMCDLFFDGDVDDPSAAPHPRSPNAPAPDPVAPPAVVPAPLAEAPLPVVPAPLPGGGKGRGKGKGKKANHPGYYSEILRGPDGAELGEIKINEHPSALSLDAHCWRCGIRRNRKFRPHPTNNASPQGRPMGALLAFLAYECHGDYADHDSHYSEEYLTYKRRRKARRRARASGQWSTHFERERDPRTDEDEPKKLC